MIHNEFDSVTFKSFSEMSSKNPKRTREVYRKLKNHNEERKKSFVEELQSAIEKESSRGWLSLLSQLAVIMK